MYVTQTPTVEACAALVDHNGQMLQPAEIQNHTLNPLDIYGCHFVSDRPYVPYHASCGYIGDVRSQAAVAYNKFKAVLHVEQYSSEACPFCCYK